MIPCAHHSLVTTGAAICFAVAISSSDASAAWNPSGNAVSTTPYDKVPSQLVADGHGGVIVVWTVWIGSIDRTELRAQRLDPSGTPIWTNDPVGVPVCVASGYRFLPHVISDGQGGVFIAWTDQGRTAAQICATHLGSDGNPVSGWAADGTRIAPTGGTQFDEDIAADGTGGVYVSWRDQRSFSPSVVGVYVQRLTGNGSVEAGWPAGGLSVSTASPFSEQPTIAADGEGGAVVCWLDHRNEPPDSSYFPMSGDIYAQRILPDARTAWEPGGRLVCGAPLRQDLPGIATDGEGGAIITWRDWRSGDLGHPDVYAERVSASGSLRWGSGAGFPVAADPGFQWFPIIVSDGTHGAYISWEGYREGTPGGLYLTRMSPDGGPAQGWPVGGRYVEGSHGGNTRPVLATANQGGIWIAWSQEDYTTGDYTVYLTEYSATGEPRNSRSLPGVVVMEKGLRYIDPVVPASHGGPIVADGAGGVYLSWSDRRGGIDHFDIYAQRIGANGRVFSEPRPEPEIVSVGPNPTRLATNVFFRMPALGMGRLDVIDAAGRRRLSLDVAGAPNQMNRASVTLASLPSGIYLIRLTGLDGTHLSSRKIVHVR